MNVSRLTFTKETREQMEKPISQFKKGELRWKKLEELENTGKLSLAKNRLDITSMMGLGTGYGAAYTWLSNMINRGSINEILLGFDKNDRPEYEYHLTNVNRPNYKKVGKANVPKPNKSNVGNKPVKPVVENFPTGKVYTVPVNDEVKMVIRYKDLTIEINNVSDEVIKRIIETLANK